MAILILDDDPDVALAARLLLQRRFGPGASASAARGPGPGLDSGDVELLLLDMNFLPGRTDGAQGLELLQRALAHSPELPVIVMTAYAEVNLAVAALKAGAFDFVTKPWDNAKLCATVAAALARRAPQGGAGQPSTLLGEAPAMRELRALIQSVAPTEANVLVLGEMGSGKELVHARSMPGANAAARLSWPWIWAPCPRPRWRASSSATSAAASPMRARSGPAVFRRRPEARSFSTKWPTCP